jgi:hypothetical protein
MGAEMDADGCAGGGAPWRATRRQTTAGERAPAGAQAAAGTATSRTRPAMETDQAEGQLRPPVETVCEPRSRSSWKQTPPWSMKWYLLDAMLAQVRRKPLVEAWLAPRVISELDHRRDSLATSSDSTASSPRLATLSRGRGNGPGGAICPIVVPEPRW